MKVLRNKYVQFNYQMMFRIIFLILKLGVILGASFNSNSNLKHVLRMIHQVSS